MTTLADVFRLLSSGELSQTHIGNLGKGISAEHQAQLADHVNLGLTALYKRFTIRRGEVTIEPLPGVYIYHLTKENSKAAAMRKYEEDLVNDPSTPVPDLTSLYIYDLNNNFLDDINKIEKVVLDNDHSIPLNDDHQYLKAETVTQTTLRLPRILVDKSPSLPQELKTDLIRVKYRAKHVPISIFKCGLKDFTDPEDINLNLPDMYLEALVYFVASRVMNPMGMNEEFHAGNNYAAKYEAECQRLEMVGLDLGNANTNYKLHQKGFV